MTTFPTGIDRLDDLLNGGLPERSAFLVHAAPYLGTDVLLRRFILANLDKGFPVVLVLTDASALDVRKKLVAADAKYEEREKAGMVRFVDAFSRSIGNPEPHPAIEYVDGLMNFNAITLALNNAQRDFIREHPLHCFAFDSASTLIAYTNAATAFRALQVMLGRVKASGGTGLVTVSQGMHNEADVQMLKHLTDGLIEMKTDNERTVLHIEGIGLTDSKGWVEYKIGPRALEVTGSFAAGRIR